MEDINKGDIIVWGELYKEVDKIWGIVNLVEHDKHYFTVLKNTCKDDKWGDIYVAPGTYIEGIEIHDIRKFKGTLEITNKRGN